MAYRPNGLRNSGEDVPMKQFATLEDFINGSNNFMLYFQEDNFLGDRYREKPVWTRFWCEDRQFARDLMERTTMMMNELFEKQKTMTISKRDKNALPWEDLYKAYQSMSGLVAKDDPHVRKEDGSFDSYYLCR